jgi:hypothetical protein
VDGLYEDVRVVIGFSPDKILAGYEVAGIFGKKNGRRCFVRDIRGCLIFSAEAKAGKFFVKQGKICSRSRAPTTKILTQYDEKLADCSPATDIQTAS